MSEGEKLHGCKLKGLSEEECSGVMEWIDGGSKPKGIANGYNWLLAHLFDGVTWGKVNEDGQWTLGSTVFPEICPAIGEDNLLEVRLFGPEREILVWRHDEGFAGRLLEDVSVGEQKHCIVPDDEDGILLGDRLIEEPKDGFSRVGTGDGREQAVPLECANEDFSGGWWPLRLKVRHYFKRDEDTGAVRVAATRLVDIYKEPR